MAGRPPFKPTAALRRKVSVAAASGMSQDDIALALGITRPTLVKHFDLELTTGAVQRRLEARDALFAQVKKGNVAAIKAWETLTASISPPLPKQDGDGDRQPTAPAAPAMRLGKKEAAQLAAAGAADGTEWADILPTHKH